MYLMLSTDPAKKPAKKRGRPKGSKNKPKKSESKKPQFETKLGETAEPKMEKPTTESKTEIKAVVKSTSQDLQTQYEAAKKAAKEAVAAETGAFTDNRVRERIFRREMGEPEFFRSKKELAPPRPILTPDEEQEISKKVLIPSDQTPKYAPEHVLSPEFGGLSNYERGIENHKLELEEKLQHLRRNADVNKRQIEQIEEELRSLDYLYENYYIGMNVFRTAKGGRSKLRV